MNSSNTTCSTNTRRSFVCTREFTRTTYISNFQMDKMIPTLIQNSATCNLSSCLKCVVDEGVHTTSQ